MRSILFVAALLITQSAFAQVQVVSGLALDRIDAAAIDMRPTQTARIVAHRSKLLPDGSPDTLAPGIENLFAVVDSSQAPVPAYSQKPAPKKQTTPFVAVRSQATTQTYGYSACANGSCGPARSYGRGGPIRRLLGRRR